VIVSERELSYADLRQIVEAFELSAEFSELHIKYGDIEVDLRKHGAAPESASTRPIAANAPAPAAAALRAGVPPEAKGAEEIDAALPALLSPPVSTAAFPSGAHIVKSPMVGTFYCAPEPGATPFVEVGQRATADTTVCIIEVMKLMNSIRAGSSGVVTHILVKDAEAVEFGQALVVIDPNV
jgi:acetyl-CoA carboxylase biotin carboxyl carrier protein